MKCLKCNIQEQNCNGLCWDCYKLADLYACRICGKLKFSAVEKADHIEAEHPEDM